MPFSSFEKLSKKDEAAARRFAFKRAMANGDPGFFRLTLWSLLFDDAAILT